MGYYVNELHYDAYLRDQISLSVTHFECEMCGKTLKLKEKKRDPKRLLPGAWCKPCHRDWLKSEQQDD